MSFVLLLLLSMSLLVSVETANAHNSKLRLLAKENARLGMLVAIGNLQRYAGPDQRVTARAEVLNNSFPGTEMWAGVWDASAGAPTNPVWLVSGDNALPSTGAAGTDPAEVFPATDDDPAVLAEWEPIFGKDGGESGSYAFWVEEQSAKARINMDGRTQPLSYLDTEADQDLAEAVVLAPSADKIFDELRGSQNPDHITRETAETLARIQSADQVGLAFQNSTDAYASQILVNERHNFTLNAASVLEDPINGGLKRNLTGITQSQIDDLLDQPKYEDDQYLKGDFLLHYNINPLSGVLFAENVDPNNPLASGGSITADQELAKVPASDFYNFRDNLTDPEDGELEVVRNIMPIVTEASFRVGAFHQWGGNNLKHRVRFHADVEFWNPYPFPIKFPAESSNRGFFVMLVPSQFENESIGRGGLETDKMILSVQKIAPGIGRGGGGIEEEIHTNLFDFDERLFTATSGDNTINETVMISWLEIERVLLEPGEVYRATTVNIRNGKNVGLARIQGGYILKSGGDRTNPDDYIVDPSGDYIKWSWDDPEDPKYPVLNPSDTVNIDLRMPPNGLTFRLISYDDRARNENPVYEENGNRDWAKPVFEIRNLYKDVDLRNDKIILRGDKYSRQTSSDYTFNDLSFAFHFRLDDEIITASDADASLVTMGFDLRQPVWDYDIPAVKRLVMVGGVYPELAETGVTPNPFDTVTLESLFFSGGDIFADGTDQNSIDSHSGTFERAFLYPPARGEPLTVGSFSRLPLSYENVEFDIDGDGTDEIVQLRVGAPWGGELNESYDKYFYTGTPAAGLSPTDELTPIPAEVTVGTAPSQLRDLDAASHLLLKGSFNVNSLSGPAWAAMLGRTIHDWEYDSSEAPTDLANGFLNLSHSTDDTIRAIGGLLSDDSLTSVDPDDLSGPVKAGRLAMRYPLRQLTGEQIFNPTTEKDDALVDFLLTELETHFASNPPFESLAEFANSGILDRAIRLSNINGSIADFSPAYITQCKVLEALAPFLSVRSDTFVVRSVGTIVDPITGQRGNQIICEAAIQRIPDRVDGDATRLSEDAVSNENSFGRRFTIVDMNWREAVQ